MQSNGDRSANLQDMEGVLENFGADAVSRYTKRNLIIGGVGFLLVSGVVICLAQIFQLQKQNTALDQEVLELRINLHQARHELIRANFVWDPAPVPKDTGYLQKLIHSNAQKLRNRAQIQALDSEHPARTAEEALIMALDNCDLWYQIALSQLDQSNLPPEGKSVRVKLSTFRIEPNGTYVPLELEQELTVEYILMLAQICRLTVHVAAEGPLSIDINPRDVNRLSEAALKAWGIFLDADLEKKREAALINSRLLPQSEVVNGDPQ